MLTDWAALPSLTWNSLGGGVQTDGVEAAANADASLASIAAGVRNINVTQSLQSWSNGAANHGWAFLMGGSNGWDFSSSEGPVAPKLTVDYFVPATGIGVTESNGSTTVAEGGQGDNFTVSLQSAPTATVTITITGNADVQTAPATLTFTPENWSTAQTVSVAAIDDALVEQPESPSITLRTSSSDPAYQGLSSSLTVRVVDNDAPALGPSVVRIHDTTQYKAGDPSEAGCSDPSGLAYVPGLNLLFIADSEHEESPFFSPTNLFAVRPNGTHVASYSLTAFCREPTGLAYNPANGYLYITDDDADKVIWVDPANPQVKVGEFSVRPLGITDAEDPIFVDDFLYVLDGVKEQMLELTPTGELLSVISLPSVMEEAEALAYDAARDVFLIGSGGSRGTVYEVDRDGDLQFTYNLLNESEYRNPVTGSKPKIKGMEVAPSSDPDDGNDLSLYVADYGADQRADGRLIEVDLHPDMLV
jgi:hypothetical protein